MFKDTLDKALGSLNKKKITEYLVILAVIGVILMITANSLWGGKEKENTQISEITALPEQTSSGDPNIRLEKKIAQILSQIQGVGKVSVMVTYASGPEIVPAANLKENSENTTEKDSGGGERRTIQKDTDNQIIYSEEQGGTKKPVILKQLTSKVMGVVVAADGGNDIVVRTNIIKAVEALTGVSQYKIQVFKRQ